jgi:Domain of unknown function (DUF6259)
VNRLVTRWTVHWHPPHTAKSRDAGKPGIYGLGVSPRGAIMRVQLEPNEVLKMTIHIAGRSWMGGAVLAVLLATQPYAATAAPSNESGVLKFFTDAATGRSSLVDKRGGATWDLGTVAEAKLADGGRSVVIGVALASNDTVRLLGTALGIAAGDAGYALVPAREGLLIPADSPVEFSTRFGTSSYEGCHMNMMGFVKRGAALLMTWDDPYIAPELKKTKGGLSCSVYIRRSPHADKTVCVSLKLTPLGRGDWNTVAAAYRKVAEAKGLVVTMREKEKRNPEAAKLAGASNAKLWTCLNRRRNEESTQDESVTVQWTFDEAAKIAEHMKNDLGINRCLFTLGGWTEGGYDCRHPDALPANKECGGNDALADAVRRIKALGYVACFHDNYQDMYRDAKSWNPDFIQKKPDGSLMAGGRWLGGRAYLVCAPKTVELAQRPQNLAAVQKLFAPQAYFIDTTYAVGPQECFDPKHPLDYGSDIHWKQKLSDYARDVFGLFGSECGREWAIAHSDFFEGLSGVSGKYYHNNIDPAKLGATVIPLFEMVYHDCEAIYGKYGYRPEGAAEYVAHHVLCGRTLNYHSFPNHLYWKELPASPEVTVKARPEIVSFEPLGPRKFRIKYRWQVDADGAGDWRVFVHFGAREPVPFQNDHAPARPVAAWRAGDVIEEGPFEVTVPDKVPAGDFDVFIGLFRGTGGSERAWLPRCDVKGRVLLGRLRLKPALALEKVESRPMPDDPGRYARAENGWAEGLCITDRFLKNTHEILGPLEELTAHARLTKLEFLTPDRLVRRVTFADKSDRIVAKVTVNFGTSSFTAQSKTGGDVALPQCGFLIEAPRFVAFCATSWAGRQYEKPVLFTVRAEGRQTRIFHGFGDARLHWHGRELTVQRDATLKD